MWVGFHFHVYVRTRTFEAAFHREAVLAQRDKMKNIPCL